MQAAKQVGGGVIFVNVPDASDELGDEIIKVLGYSPDNITFATALKSNIDPPLDARNKLAHALEIFERGAKKYKAKHGRPPVLILDNINNLGKQNPDLLELLQ